MGVGNTRYRAGDLPGAEQAFRRASALDPQLGPAWNNLAHVLAERGELEAARATLGQALALDGPWRELYLRTLGEIERR
jgi:Flp pilus assembly protein TadD